jgi:predicted outer membrane repeat protein
VASASVSNCTLSGNSTDGNGGAIYNNAGTLTLSNSTLSSNSAIDGAGIFNTGLLDVHGCKLSANTASDSGGGIYNVGPYSAATIEQSNLSGNTAGSAGGGIFNAASGTLTIDDSIVLNNSAPLGADVFNLGALTLNDSTVGVLGP